MFDRFTNPAKQLMSHARLAVLRLHHDVIAPEHLLLGLLDVGPCVASHVLQALGVSGEKLRAEVLAAVTPGHQPVTATQLPFTPAAKRVLELTMEHAVALDHNYIGTEHVLLALTSADAGIPARALARVGATEAALRAAVLAYLAQEPATEAGRHQPLPGDPRHAAAPDRSKVRALLISNSTMHGGGYLAHCAQEIRDFLGPRKRVLFVPYALHDHDGYAQKARAAFEALGHELVSAHESAQPAELLAGCDAVFVGGGNTFRLLKALYDHGLLAAIRQRAFAGMPYVGSSAGTNVATLSIRTTNDMPIVQPPSFDALALVPFQINPHYLDPDPHSKHMGETREERLRQFHEEHDTPVLGLREGCLLRVEGGRATLKGTTNARLFRRGEAPVEYTPPCDLSFLLQPAPR